MLKSFEDRISYSFRNKSLLKEALTHSSYTNEKNLSYSNERLEFLGDAVLELITSEYIYNKHPDMDEGLLTVLRSNIVCETSLAKISKSIDLGEYLYLGKGEDRAGGTQRNSILSDTMEAVIGAMYLDGGVDCVRKLVLPLIPLMEPTVALDNKSQLQKILQSSSNDMVFYDIVNESGPDHEKTFVSQVRHQDVILGQGQGKSKKIAEQEAALDALVRHFPNEKDEV